MPSEQHVIEQLRKQGVKEIDVVEHPAPPNPGRPARQGIIVVNNLTRDADLQTSRQPDIWYELPTDMAVGIQNEQNGRWAAEMRLLDRLSIPDRERQAQEQAADEALWAEVYQSLPAEVRSELETALQRLETAQQEESHADDLLMGHQERKSRATTFEQQREWRRMYDSLKDTYDTHVATVAQAYSAWEAAAEHAHRAMFALAVERRMAAQAAQRQAEEDARLLEQLAQVKRAEASAAYAATGRLCDRVRMTGPVIFEEV